MLETRARTDGRPVAALLLAFVVHAPGPARADAAVVSGAHAFVGGHVIVAPGREIEGATLVVRDGLVEAVGTDVAIPPDARTWNVAGSFLWPGFVDPHVSLSRLAGESPEPRGSRRGGRAEPAPRRGSATGHANTLVHPELQAVDVLEVADAVREAFHGEGFTTVRAVPDHGVMRGRGAVVTLAEGPVADTVVRGDDDVHVAFQRGAGDAEGYPSSVMGAVALFRQTMLDAAWYQDALRHAERRRVARPARDAALEALAPLVGRRPRGRLVFHATDVLDALRFGRLAREIDQAHLIVGAGDEYRLLDDVRALDVPVILPVAFPDAPRATDEDEWLDVSLRALRHWDVAPDNPRFLEEAGVDVMLTTDRLEKVGEFGAAVRRCIERGLDEATALAMVTVRPARLLGLEDRLGTLEPGRLANVVVADGRPFEDGATVREVWIDGRRHVLQHEPEGAEGTWRATVRVGDRTLEARLSLRRGKGTLTWPKDAAPGGAGAPQAAADAGPPPPEGGDGGRTRRESIDLEDVVLTPAGARFRLDAEALGLPGEWDVEVVVRGGEMEGTAEGAALSLTARRLVGPAAQPERPREPEEGRDLPERPGPLAPGDDLLVRGATVWTCAAAGTLDGMDVLVRDGRIAAVGADLSPPAGTPVVEAEGLHLTPGLVDAHSHAAIVGGVNEGTHSCTAEVRIRDVVNSETPHLYRQLAGGLTTAHLLHGSANTIGGQSQVIKLRPGASPEGLLFVGAQPGIKFALGENVKQSNWGEDYTTRFPQTRMGVEQFLRQMFATAVDYRTAHADWRRQRGRADALPPRRDLQMEALVEVLEGRRSVHCHSYRQDEILMMMRVAEEFGFRMGTFQHVLEGYKVADELAAHGAMASTFSDWWAYKFEVYDAIPYNGALMWERGVVVSFNSDSSELARRMNLEAAKAVRWGGVPPEEALRFVTLNPARQLGVEDRVGSIEVGKDADLVLWSAPPLSSRALALRTWVDGRLYYDREEDRARRTALEAEREELVARARRGPGGGGTTRRRGPAYFEEGGWSCHDGVAAGGGAR